MISDQEFLQTLKLQLSGRDTIPVSHECLARLIGMAEGRVTPRGQSFNLLDTKAFAAANAMSDE